MNYENLKATIAANIYTNGNQEVTAEMVKTAMNEVVNTLGAGYQYMGVAHPDDAAASYDQHVFFIATEPGTYTNKGGLQVAEGEVAILKYDTAWRKEVTGAATAAQVTELGHEVSEEVFNILSALYSLQRAIVDNQDGYFTFCDGDGNVIAKIGTDGVSSRYVVLKDASGQAVGTFLDDESGEYYFCDANGNVIAKISQDGKIDAAGFGPRLAALISNGASVVNCVGDSITQGQIGLISPSGTATADNAYPEKMKAMLPDFVVRNYGYGGNNPSEIIATMGISAIVVGADFILKADGTTSALSNLTDALSGYGISNILTQYRTTDGLYAEDAQKKCFVCGVPCVLSKSGSTYYIKRETAGGSDIHIKSGMTIQMYGAKEKSAVYVFFIGQNNIAFYNDTANWVKYMRKITDSVPGGRFIVIGIPQSNATYVASVKATNAALRQEFGGRFIDLQQFLNNLASFDLMGMTPTTDADITQERANLGVLSDTALMAAERTPSSWWRYSALGDTTVDSVHLNGVAYEAIAKLVSAKIKELNF